MVRLNARNLAPDVLAQRARTPTTGLVTSFARTWVEMLKETGDCISSISVEQRSGQSQAAVGAFRKAGRGGIRLWRMQQSCSRAKK